MVEKTKLTKAGYKKLKDELRYLIDVARPENNEALKAARDQGDLSENADYDAARNKQAEIESRIKEIEDVLANSVILEETNKNKNKVALGSKVTIRFLETNKEDTYLIVGTIEADAFAKHISNASPLGGAVVGKSVGDIVEIKALKTYKVEIVKIEN